MDIAEKRGEMIRHLEEALTLTDDIEDVERSLCTALHRFNILVAVDGHSVSLTDVTDASGSPTEALDYYPHGGLRVSTWTNYGGVRNKYAGRSYATQATGRAPRKIHTVDDLFK
jgi:hypothetical protein